MLGEVIKLTAAPAIQPSVVHITGPLIRILGDRFNANVKAAVLETLALLLSKVLHFSVKLLNFIVLPFFDYHYCSYCSTISTLVPHDTPKTKRKTDIL